jgi:hypothetical protein
MMKEQIIKAYLMICTTSMSLCSKVKMLLFWSETPRLLITRTSPLFASVFQLQSSFLTSLQQDRFSEDKLKRTVRILKCCNAAIWEFLEHEFSLKGATSKVTWELLDSSHWRALSPELRLQVLHDLCKDKGGIVSATKAIDICKALPGTVTLKTVLILILQDEMR